MYHFVYLVNGATKLSFFPKRTKNNLAKTPYLIKMFGDVPKFD